MFFIKINKKSYISSQSIVEINRYGNDIMVRCSDGKYRTIYNCSPSELLHDSSKIDYIMESIMDAITEMVAKDSVNAIEPSKKNRNPYEWSYTKIEVPLPDSSEMILDIQEVIEIAEEEFDISKKKD